MSRIAQLEADHADYMRREVIRLLGVARWDRCDERTVTLIEAVFTFAWPEGASWIHQQVYQAWANYKKERSPAN